MAMYRCGSNSGGVTPTSITPSNVTPAAMSSGVIYETTAAGYAIASYDSKTPDDTTPPSVTSGEIVKMGGAGYLYATQQAAGSWEEVEAVSQVPGGNATFTISHSLTVGNLYHIFTTIGANTLANATTGAEITVSSGASNFTKIEEISGYFNSSAYYSVIEHYTFIATSATVVFNKVATAKRLGYILYDTQGSLSPGAYTNYGQVYVGGLPSGTKTHTITGQAGKKLLVLFYGFGSSGKSMTLYDDVTTNDGSTLSKISNATVSNGQYMAGTFYNLNVATNSCTLTSATDGAVQAFLAQ